MKSNDSQGIALIVICGALITIVTLLLFNIADNKTYEYAKNGEIKESKECYQREDGICFCKEENNFIQVDNYYEVKK